MANSSLKLRPMPPQPLPGGGLEWQTHVTLNDWEKVGLTEPLWAERARLVDMERDPVALNIKMARDSVQRPFLAARKRNAISYRDYWLGLLDGKMAFTPAITMWVEKAAISVDGGGLDILSRSALFPIDGETQLEALYMVRVQRPDIGDTPFKYTIVANVSQEFAKVILVDLNSHGMRVGKKIVKSLDPRGVVISAGTRAIIRARLDPDINISRFACGGRKAVAGREQINAALVGVVLGGTIPWGSQFDSLNSADLSIADEDIAIVVKLLEEASENDHFLRRAEPYLWQAAAAVIRTGRQLPLSYQSALEAVAARRCDETYDKKLNATERLCLYRSNL